MSGSVCATCVGNGRSKEDAESHGNRGVSPPTWVLGSELWYLLAASTLKDWAVSLTKPPVSSISVSPNIYLQVISNDTVHAGRLGVLLGE